MTPDRPDIAPQPPLPTAEDGSRIELMGNEFQITGIAPQPPHTPRCATHGLRTCEECGFGDTDAKRIEQMDKRFAELQRSREALRYCLRGIIHDCGGQTDGDVSDAFLLNARAEVQGKVSDLTAKLSLAAEAMKAAEVFVDYIWQMIPLNSKKTGECNAVAAQLDIALTALAPAVAEHAARLKREGAAEELRAMAEDLERKAAGGAGVLAYRISASKCKARAAELDPGAQEGR